MLSRCGLYGEGEHSMTVDLLLGDCLEVMATMEPCSVDAIVTDPPYGLEFMGKEWDKLGGGVERTAKSAGGFGKDAATNVNAFAAARVRYDSSAASMQDWHYRWAVAALRVAKPGAHLLAFGGTRTHHRLMCAIEDAGWQIRDTIMWVYGSGFPKSHNVANSIDKSLGMPNRGRAIPTASTYQASDVEKKNKLTSNIVPPYEARTEASAPWEGWGTALKPAWEPIIVARKPLVGPVAANVTEYGTGAMNIDGCRVGTADGHGGGRKGSSGFCGNHYEHDGFVASTLGRWPANLIHDGSDEVTALMPRTQSGALNRANITAPNQIYGRSPREMRGEYAQNSGSAARFFYCAKASKADRNSGLDGTCIVKYTVPIGGPVCKDVTTALVESLKKAMSESTVTWLIGESGASITGLCPSDTLSTTLMEISRITPSTILRSLTPSLISACTLDANCETESGGSRAESAASSSECLPTSTNESQAASVHGASRVVSQMLSQISDAASWKPRTNVHATVKPTALMRYLCRLVTQPGGVVLDPFMGSGSTGKAAVLEGFRFVGIDIDQAYIEIARQRIEQAGRQRRLPIVP